MIVVKCFQSNRSSVQSLQSPHPTHHIFNFTTFPIGHIPNTNAPCQCHQNAPSPSEATPLKLPPPMKRFNKKTAKKTKKQTLSPHPASTAKQASHTHLPTSTQKSKVNVNATSSQFLTPNSPSPTSPHSANPLHTFISLWHLG